jgi:uncharacterized membrane protein YbaN (DUF454 family)
MSENRLVNLSLGWTFVLLGLVGAVFPVLQGFLFFFVGILFLSKEYHWAHKLVAWIRIRINKFSPKLGKVFESAEKFLESEVHKIGTEKNYIRKKLWVWVGIILLLVLAGWVLVLLAGWLIDFIFRR